MLNPIGCWSIESKAVRCALCEQEVTRISLSEKAVLRIIDNVIPTASLMKQFYRMSPLSLWHEFCSVTNAGEIPFHRLGWWIRFDLNGEIISLRQSFQWKNTIHMKIIVKMKFGAHLYGTATPDSDMDYKGIFLPTKEELLLGRVPKSYNYSTGREEKNRGIQKMI